MGFPNLHQHIKHARICLHPCSRTCASRCSSAYCQQQCTDYARPKGRFRIVGLGIQVSCIRFRALEIFSFRSEELSTSKRRRWVLLTYASTYELAVPLPKAPCTYILYTQALQYPLTPVRPKYMLYRYMEPWGLYA